MLVLQLRSAILSSSSIHASRQRRNNVSASAGGDANIAPSLCAVFTRLLLLGSTAVPSPSSSVDGATTPPRIADFQTRPLDCDGCCRVLALLYREAELRRKLSLALLKEVNAGRSTCVHAKSVCRELMHQIAMIQESSGPLVGCLGDEVADAADFRRVLWQLYAELSSVCAALACVDPHHVVTGTQVNEICFWVDEMTAALRRAGAPSLHSAQVALGSALPFLSAADEELALRFRRTLANVYGGGSVGGSETSRQSTLTYIPPLAKVHFILVVALPFVLTHFVWAYLLNVYHRLDWRTCGTAMACVAVVYALFFKPSSLSTARRSDVGSEILPVVIADRLSDSVSAAAENRGGQLARSVSWKNILAADVTTDDASPADR